MPVCRVCGATGRKIELAHVIGTTHDLKNVSVCEHGGHSVRVATVLPDRVVPLCGPQQQPGTCHYRLDLGHDLELWDHLTRAEKVQAVSDAGSLGQALKRCARPSYLDRIEIRDGVQVEVPSSRAAA